MTARVAMSDGVHTLDFPAEHVDYMHSLGWGIRAAEPETDPEPGPDSSSEPEPETDPEPGPKRRNRQQ